MQTQLPTVTTTAPPRQLIIHTNEPGCNKRSAAGCVRGGG